MSKSAPDLVTTSEAAKMLGRGYQYIIRRVHDGRLTPAQKLPGLRGAFLFHRDDIVELIGEADAKSASDAA